MVAASPNYTEMKFDLVARGEKYEWVTVLIQKGSGKTPHQLRQEAERERDELKAILANVRDHRHLPAARSVPGAKRPSTERDAGRCSVDRIVSIIFILFVLV
jgi:hypothetical protein